MPKQLLFIFLIGISNLSQAATLSTDHLSTITETINQAQIALAEPNLAKATHLLETLLTQLAALPASYHKTQGLIQSAEIAQTIDNPVLLSQAWGYLGQQYEQALHYDDAITLTRRAIFKAQEAHALAWLIRWTWQLGRLFKAQDQIEQAIQAYQQALQILIPDQTFRWEMTECQTPKPVSLYKKIRPLFLELADLLLQRAAQKKTDLAAKQPDLQQARNTIEQLKTADLENYFGDCFTAFQAQFQSVEEFEDPHAAVIYPILLEERLELLISFPRPNTQQTLQSIIVPVGRAKMTLAIRQFNNQLPEGRYDLESTSYLTAAQQLYNWLIVPLQPILTQNDINTLIFVPEGILGTLSIAALHDGQAFLIETYAVAIIPGLSLTDPKSSTLTPLQTTILLSGITEEIRGYPKLNYAQLEIDAITEFYGHFTKILNKQFIRPYLDQTLKQANYHTIHIISHAEFAQNVKDSFIITYDGKLTLDQLESLVKVTQYRQQPIELLTLSACNTAQGDEEWGALGLSGIALKAGAQSSLATLWKAHDFVTYSIIKAFYQQLTHSSQSKAQALQAAQQATLESIYHHPFYWAPFVLIGNWL